MNDSKTEAEDGVPAGRNIGCCRLAAATDGRQHSPVCVNGIAAARAVIEQFVDGSPNSFRYIMSPADDHPDRAGRGVEWTVQS